MKTSLLLAGLAASLTTGLTLANTNSNKICLYKAASTTSKCLKKIKVTTPLVAIISSKDGRFTKIGLRDNNGSTGWVSNKQFSQANNKVHQADIQTIYISSNNTNNGKSSIDIVAYNNGKKLSDSQAQALYKKIRRNQQRETLAMRHFNHSFNRIFRDDMLMMQHNMNNLWGPAISNMPDATEINLPPLGIEKKD